ncbi:unnamed protein product [Paramecium primaurelia]|uniref:Uncharacterized protein n=1 Tax=Paramecium primaurelia TaxID=5886 RepID=A0A8S1L4Q5_PARPR|nr:unnamed protein product [Paramecium primaurelia]
MKSKPNLSITVNGAKLLQDLDKLKGKSKQDPYTLIQLVPQKVQNKISNKLMKIFNME